MKRHQPQLWANWYESRSRGMSRRGRRPGLQSVRFTDNKHLLWIQVVTPPNSTDCNLSFTHLKLYGINKTWHWNSDGSPDFTWSTKKNLFFLLANKTEDVRPLYDGCVRSNYRVIIICVSRVWDKEDTGLINLWEELALTRFDLPHFIARVVVISRRLFLSATISGKQKFERAGIQPRRNPVTTTWPFVVRAAEQ